MHVTGLRLHPVDRIGDIRVAKAIVRGLTGRWRPNVSRDAMLIIGALVGVGQVIGVVPSPVDAVNYWNAGTSSQLYPEFWTNTAGAFLFYPPPVAQLSTLLQPIGWTAFIVTWTTILFACFWWCARDWSLPLIGLGMLFVVGFEVPGGDSFLGYALLGNMQWLLAVLVVQSIRHPSGWAGLVWTKMGPAVGGLWHMFRGDWPAVRRAAISTLVVGLVSFALAPQMWVDWVGFVVRNADLANPPMPMFPVPFAVRLAAACIIVAIAARANKAWLVPIAAGLAIPALWGLGFLPFWVAALRLRAPAVHPVTVRVPTPGLPEPYSVMLPGRLVPVMDPVVAGAEQPRPAVPV